MLTTVCVLLPALSLFSANSQDVEVIDQDGNTVHFYGELIKDRVVAINFIFTNCQTICTVLGAKFAKVDKLLSDRHVSGVRLISISVDPVNDRPEQLRRFAARYGVTHQWKLVTGDKGNIEQLLRSLGEYSPEKTAHTGLTLIGRGGGNWVRVDGLGPAERIADFLTVDAAQRSARNGQ